MNFIGKFKYDFRFNKALMLMILPAVLFFALFAYIPMGGIIIAFKRLDYMKGIFGSPWIGFNNFKFFFLTGKAWTVTRNTVLYNAAFIAVGTILQVSVAVFLSEIGKKFFKKITQSLMLLPYFVSWVVVAAIVYNIFNFDYGLLNTTFKSLGIQPLNVYQNPGAWIPMIIFFQAWKSAGYGSIIYMAAIMGIDAEMYEAADIDGATIFQKIRRITLPSLLPTVIILTLLAIGQIFRGDFNMFYNLIGNNGLLFNATDVIDTYSFRTMLYSQDFGMAAAVGLFQSVLCCAILMVTNFFVRRADPDRALF